MNDLPEVQARVKSFNEELIPLLGKYKLGLGAVAFLLPDGRIGARVHVFDDVPQEPKAEEEKPVKAE